MSEARYEDKFQRARREAMEHMPALLALRHDVTKHLWIEPVAVTLPREIDPGPYEGDGATDSPATFMGLPIVWGDRAALVYAPPDRLT